MCIIFFSDVSGGVKTVSESMSAALSKHSVAHEVINLKNVKGFLIFKLFTIISMIKKHSKKTSLILQHFDAIFLGVFLSFFGFRNKINVVHIDLVDYYNSVGFFKKAIIKFIFFIVKNENVVFVSKEAESKARLDFNLKKTFTIYNFYDFNKKNISLSCADSSKVILGSISRLHSVKNIDLLIRVAKSVFLKNNNIELLIYGDGDQKKLLEEYIVDQGCSDFVKLMGSCNDKDKMYSTIDAMVSFSSIEGLPTVILESISYGKPVLYTDCSSGPRELMSSDTDPTNKTSSYEKTNVGYLVKPAKKVAGYSIDLDEYELEYVNIMHSFINDLKKNAFNMSYDTTRFSEEVIVKKWQELIEGLAANSECNT